MHFSSRICLSAVLQWVFVSLFLDCVARIDVYSCISGIMDIILNCLYTYVDLLIQWEP
jgi:hypothetical protein